MEELKKNIQQAEEKWLSALSNYCANVFNGTIIPSHDHSHHLRVWEYSKEIIKALYNSYQIDYELIESCLIASLFHDTGLTKTLSENHGSESRKICIRYFDEQKLPKPDQFKEILFAIENHDDKNYKQNNAEPNSIFSIVCNADDLDALGRVGIIRYTEIYLLRGNTMNQLPDVVVSNLEKRFSNFKRTYQNYNELYKKHYQRYLETKKFFQDLKEEL